MVCCCLCSGCQKIHHLIVWVRWLETTAATAAPQHHSSAATPLTTQPRPGTSDVPCRHWSPHLATRGNIYTCPSIGQTKCPAEAAAGCHAEGADRLLVSAGKSRTALSGQAVMGDLLHSAAYKSLFDIFCQILMYKENNLWNNNLE